MQRYLAPSDFSAAETWRLVDWCRRLGADEFTIDCVGTSSLTDEKLRRPFETIVQPFVRPEGTRERMSGRTADDLTRATNLWELNEVTVQALKWALPNGILAYDPAEQGWFEDPVFYREGNLLLGVLSREAFAVLRLSDVEAEQLSEARFLSHDSLPRIG